MTFHTTSSMDFSQSPQSLSPTLPEEILECIIALALTTEDTHQDYCRPRTFALSILLVSKTFDRIAKPFLYGSLYLRTREQSDRLAETFNAHPEFGAHIRAIRVATPSASRAFLAAARILSNSPEPSRRVLEVLDVSLTTEIVNSSQSRQGLEQLNSALCLFPDTKRLVVRYDAYIGCNVSFTFTHALASGVDRWKSLETVDFRTRPMPLPTASGGPRSDPLAAALSRAPNLKVFRARRPTLLNSFLLDVANNPALQRIELVLGPPGSPFPDIPVPPFPHITRRPLVNWEGRPSNVTEWTPCSPWRQSLWDAPNSERSLGIVSPDPETVEIATAKLEALLQSEPQTLFASQIIAHPRLSALIRAGRLQLIIDHLMAKNERYLGGDVCADSKDGNYLRPCECDLCNRVSPK